MSTEELQKKLEKLFSQSIGKTGQDYLVDKILHHSITIRETEKTGAIEVSFCGASFIRFAEKMLGTNKFIAFFNRLGGDILRKICDGIFLAILKDRIILCLVELKLNITNNFEKALKQVEGSYLKIVMLLSLLYDIKTIDIAVFLGGRVEKVTDDPDIDFLEKSEEFRENANNLEAKLKEISNRGRISIHLPFFLGHIIHENYRNQRVHVYHLEPGSAFDMQTLMPLFR